MVDIHCHLLPGVDDGAGDTSDAAAMAAIAASSGVDSIIVTPHCHLPGLYRNDWGTGLEEKLRQLQQELHRRQIPVTLYPGQEIFLSHPFGSQFGTGAMIGLNHSRYPLVEFSPQDTLPAALHTLRRLRAEGLVPVLAHPERFPFVYTQPEEAARQLKAAGILLQVNRGSVLGRFGFREQRAACFFLRNRQADFVASDAHSPYRRTPHLADVHEWICENVSFDYAAFVLEKNPHRLLDDAVLYPYSS